MFKKIWHDFVWSKVIAALILSALAVIWAGSSFRLVAACPRHITSSALAAWSFNRGLRLLPCHGDAEKFTHECSGEQPCQSNGLPNIDCEMPRRPERDNHERWA
jgi:hypothetical protein